MYLMISKLFLNFVESECYCLSLFVPSASHIYPQYFYFIHRLGYGILIVQLQLIFVLDYSKTSVKHLDLTLYGNTSILNCICTNV